MKISFFCDMPRFLQFFPMIMFFIFIVTIFLVDLRKIPLHPLVEIFSLCCGKHFRDTEKMNARLF